MERKERAEVEPRSCQETNTRKETQQKQGENRRETKHSEKRKERNRTKAQPNQQHRSSFNTVAEGSDAESKVGQRLSGVPPWETQRECTNELIGSDLDGHEKLGRHP